MSIIRSKKGLFFALILTAILYWIISLLTWNSTLFVVPDTVSTGYITQGFPLMYTSGSGYYFPGNFFNLLAFLVDLLCYFLVSFGLIIVISKIWGRFK